MSPGAPHLNVVFDINVYLDVVVGVDDVYPPVLEEVPPTTGNSAADALSLALDNVFSLHSSPHIVRNVISVMRGAGQNEGLVRMYMELLADIWETSGGAVVDPLVRDFGIGDFEDNNILALALDPAVNASVLVTSDHHLLDIGPAWHGIWIARPHEFVKELLRRGR